ncbi:epidermal growth factor receptor kinase substrate 8-like protein 1 isoform X2 [Culicoides brevitarsis]|uniref:epidermal growth factor receptor kinase substrate 8-like protein 1 isoform X2 n=1 Tax=Culicoides brevitarsis TaxID=469753 RepID=UPI00307CB5F8
MAYRHSPIAAYSGDDLESRSGDDRPESVNLDDLPVYELEHLATFTVTKETGILYPADGMRKLLQLEKTTGIWSQKMKLCLDRSWVLIMDFETGNIIERFQAASIQEPTAFTSNDPMEMYNNILVFIVGTGGPNSRSEMHIFQCQRISAVHLVEDLKQLRDGKLINSRDAMPHYEQQRNRPVIGASGGGRANRAEYIRDREREREERHYNHNNDTDSELGGLNDETSSTSSEKYERDVTVLNHCFDDIEKFIARLQHAAAASRELERRRKNRKSKKKDPGEGLLTLRTRPPHEKEFVDIFSKFKLSFNLLAKLKAHIHDPNAPELVHFLFTPLALIVDASHDSYYDPNLPARVVTPLLTRDAINLLVNCVTSKETELWRSLGDAWTIPRDQWKDGAVTTYHPVFFDGWSPEFPVIDELDAGVGPSTPNNHKKRFDLLPSHSQDYTDYEFDHNAHHPPHAGSPGLRDFSARSEISVDSIERNGERGANGGSSSRNEHHHAIVHHHGHGPPPPPNVLQHHHPSSSSSHHQNNGVDRGDTWIEDLQAKGAKIVQVTYPRTANNDKELTVERGEYLEILDDSRKWWKARNARGQIAHVPHTIVSVVTYENGDGPYRNGKDDRYQGSNSNNNDTSPGSADWVRNKHLVNGNGVSSFQRYSSFTSEHSLEDRRSVTEPTTPVGNDMHRELKEVLTLFREKKRNIEIIRTPDIYITQTSNPEEVQNWLREKCFSENAMKRLKGLTGNELFALKKETLEEYCGTEEGKRLASQITIQRNVSGYKTTRSSELMGILAKVRQKTEGLNGVQELSNENHINNESES